MLHSTNFFTTTQAAELLSVSRITIFRWIKNGSLKAAKIGRNYVLPKDEIYKRLYNLSLSTIQKSDINTLINKTIKDYGETIRMLGRE